MTSIQYVTGDATSPQGNEAKIICHICNNAGGWGKGFVVAISKRWKEPEAAYRQWFKTSAESGFALGEVQFVQVEPQLWVANMVAQRNYGRRGSGPPIQYDSVAKCLRTVAGEAKTQNATVHMPRIGCGLAGGEWSVIEPLIEQHLLELGIEVTVYDFA